MSALSLYKTAVTNGYLFTLEEEFLDGKLHTQTELNEWRARYALGNKWNNIGDEYANSLGDYARVKSNALDVGDGLGVDDITDAQAIAKAYTTTPEATDSVLTMPLDWSLYSKWGAIRDASFVDLIEQTSIHTARVKELILLQVRETTMDYSNSDWFSSEALDGNWLHAENFHKMLLAYTYLPDGTFTTAEVDEIKIWFDNLATWIKGINGERYWRQSEDGFSFNVNVFDVRAYMPRNSIANIDNTSKYVTTDRYGYEGSQPFFPPGFYITNRQLGMTNFLVAVGAVFGIDEYLMMGSQFVKEYVAFYTDENGYFSELQRCTEDRPNYGLGYWGYSYLNILEISHKLKHTNFDMLFDYKTKTNMSGIDGSMVEGTTEKSLEWIAVKFVENFLMSSSPSIYPYGSVVQDLSTVINMFTSTSTTGDFGAIALSGRVITALRVANKVFSNTTISSVLTGTNGNKFGWSDLVTNQRPGALGVQPTNFFQYADTY